MNWTRYKLLIISGGITLVLSGGLIFWILSTRGKSEEVNSQIRNLNQRQSNLFSEKPYPSNQNFDLVKAEQAKVEAKRDELKSIISDGQIDPQVVTRSRFGDYIKRQLVPTLRKMAKESTKGGEHGVILTDPDFGLTEYMEGVLPETSRIPTLMLELETMSHLSKTLFDSGISELVLVKAATDVDAPKTRGRARPPVGIPGPPMMGRGVDVNEDEGLSNLEIEKKRLFSSIDYRLEFKVYEDYLWELLNAMLSDPNQLVITELYITNANETLWPDYLKPIVGVRTRADKSRSRQRPTRREPANDIERLLMGATGAQTEDLPEEKEEVLIAGLSDRRQNIIGGDLLNVVIVVRVYRLNDETAENEQGS